MTNIFLQRKRNKILSIHKELLSAKNFKPSKSTNAIFSRLVAIVQNTPPNDSREILNDNNILQIQDNLRRISSKAESELELFWTNNIIKSNEPEKILRLFPYYSNYDKMSDLEFECMQSCNIHKVHKVLFVGSGPLPLPLSSILMARKYGISIDNLDMDNEACTISRELIEKLGLSEKIKTIEGNILDIQDLSGYHTIFIAALAGENEKAKEEIINHVVTRSNRNNHIVMRSVNNLGALLYPKITLTHLKNIEVISMSESPRDIINNIIIGKKK